MGSEDSPTVLLDGTSSLAFEWAGLTTFPASQAQPSPAQPDVGAPDFCGSWGRGLRSQCLEVGGQLCTTFTLGCPDEGHDQRGPLPTDVAQRTWET